MPSDWPACISAADSGTPPGEPSAAPEPGRISKPAPSAPDTSTVSSNVTVRTPVPPSRAADSTSGFTVSGVSAISAAAAGPLLVERSLAAPASRRTYGSAYPMTDCLSASVSLMLIRASASTTSVTSEPVSAVPPAPSPSRTRIFFRSTDTPSPTYSSKFNTSTPVPSSTDAETSAGPVVSAVGVPADFATTAGSATSVPDALKALALIDTSSVPASARRKPFCAGLSPTVATALLIESDDVESSVSVESFSFSPMVIFPSASALLVCAAMFWSNVSVSLPACRLPPCAKLFRSTAAELSTGSRASRAEAAEFPLLARSTTASASRCRYGAAYRFTASSSDSSSTNVTVARLVAEATDAATSFVPPPGVGPSVIDILSWRTGWLIRSVNVITRLPFSVSSVGAIVAWNAGRVVSDCPAASAAHAARANTAARAAALRIMPSRLRGVGGGGHAPAAPAQLYKPKKPLFRQAGNPRRPSPARQAPAGQPDRPKNGSAQARIAELPKPRKLTV